MIVLPKDFIPIHIDGYFWSTTDQILYTIKGGILKPLSGPREMWTKKGKFVGWSVSHEGKRQYITLDSLKKLTLTDETIELPVIRYVKDTAKKYKPLDVTYSRKRYKRFVDNAARAR